MPHEKGLINFCLPEPALLLCGEEDFDSHSLPPPFSHPHLSVSPFSDLLDHLNLLGDGALNLFKRKKKSFFFYSVTELCFFKFYFLDRGLLKSPCVKLLFACSTIACTWDATSCKQIFFSFTFHFKLINTINHSKCLGSCLCLRY